MLLSTLLTACGLSTQAAPDRVAAHLGAGYQTTIPLRRLETGHQLLQASINGHRVQLIVDTGAEGLVINDDDRELLGVDPEQIIGTERAAGIGGPIVATKHAIDSFAVAGTALAATSTAATDLGLVLGSLGQIAGGRIQGILGQDVLMAHGAVIDVGDDRLHLRTGADGGTGGLHADLVASGYRPIALEPLANGMQALSARINNVPARLVLDSGARLSVLDASRAERWRLAPTRSTSRVGGAGGAGSAQVSERALRSIALDSFPVDVDKVVTMDLSALAAALLERGGLEVDGVLGLDVLHRHRAIIDLANATLYLADPVRSP